jgi:Ion channel
MRNNRGALVAGALNVPLLWLVASVVAWLFTSASCLAVMEQWSFHEALYFVTSTVTTVGYGDLVARSGVGAHLIACVMMKKGHSVVVLFTIQYTDCTVCPVHCAACCTHCTGHAVLHAVHTVCTLCTAGCSPLPPHTYT